LTALITDPDAPDIARATGASLQRFNGNITSLNAIEQAIIDPVDLVRLGGLQALESVPEKTRIKLALPLLNDPTLAIRIEAARLLASTPKTVFTTAQRHLVDRVLEEYIAAQLVNAERPESHLNLGVLYTQLGRLTDAESEYLTAIRLAPRSAEGRVNLSDLYRAMGREEESEALLETVLADIPGHPEASHALGLLLVRRGETENAMSYLEAAAGAAPRNSRFAYVLAVAIHSMDRLHEANLIAEQALALHPFDAELLSLLISFSGERGKPEETLSFARRLAEVRPADVGLQQFIRSLATD